MPARRPRALLALAALALAAGCGHPGAPTGRSLPAGLPEALKARAEQRAFGYDADRYQTKLAKTARKVAMPRQGLRPARVDLRAKCSPVAAQGYLSSCTAFSLAKGLREYLQRADGERQVPLSALWLYYEERALKGPQFIEQNVGVNLAEGMRVLEKQGCAEEAHAPYDIARFAEKPVKAAYDSAGAWKIRGWQELAGFEDVKSALAAGKPVAFGSYIHTSFFAIGEDGKMPMPKAGEPRMGGHAMLAVGYDDKDDVLIVRNSWGAEWGDDGYLYMPYAFAQDPKRAMEWVTIK